MKRCAKFLMILLGLSAIHSAAAADAKGHKNAPKLPSPGRQSIMTRFSKSKDKKAA